MPSTFLKSLLPMTLCLTLFLLCGCGTFRRVNFHGAFGERDTADVQDQGLSRLRPKSYVFYPFRNTSYEDDAGIRARREIAAQFSLLGEVKSLSETDKRAGAVSTLADAIRVGREMGAEAVVVGQVTNETHLWLFMASVSNADVVLTIYSTQSGKRIWSGATWASSQSAGPLLIPEIFHSMGSERHTSDIYHRIGADFVNTINAQVYSNQVPKIKK